MKELRNRSTRNGYIRGKAREILGVELESIDFVDVGVMNYVYRAVTPTETIFFKQALPRAKKADQIGGDLASISPERIRYEKNVISALQPIMPPEIVLPRIYQYDEENNILILGDVAARGILLEDALLQGDFNPTVAANVGRFLAISHKETYGKQTIVRGSAGGDKHNWEVVLNMRTKGIGTGPSTKQHLIRLYDEVLNNHTYDVLINMDCCPKNVFQRQDGSIGLIDFELSSGCGDPAYDVGFTLGHYFLFSIPKKVPDQAVNCFNSILSSYIREFSDLDYSGFERIMKYAGAVLIYRVAGSSPVFYISNQRVEECKRKGSAIITNNTNSLTEAIKILREG